MPEVRVQDEQGNIHVFPDGSTPEMIAQAMNVKPPSSGPPQQPGFSTMFGRTMGAPTSPEEASGMLMGKSGQIEGAPDSAYNPQGGVNLPGGFNPGNAARNVFTNVGQSIADRIKSGSQQFKEAAQNVREGGPILSNIGKGLSGYTDIISAVNPVVNAGGESGKEFAKGNISGGLGAFTAGMIQGGMAGRGIDKPTAPPSPGELFQQMRPKGPQAYLSAKAAGLPIPVVQAAEGIFQAAAPTGTNVNFREGLYTAIPDLAEVARKVNLDEAKGGVINPDMRVRETVKAIDAHLKDMYNTERAPQIQAHATEPVKLSLDLNARRGLEYLANHAGLAEEQALAAQALKTGKLSVAAADKLATTANQYLLKYESGTPEAKAQMEATSPKVGGLKALDRSVGNSLNSVLEAAGEPGLRGYEQRYAALSRVRDGLRPRINAEELKRNIDLGMVGKGIKAVTGGKSGIASASQAAVADVNVGRTLQASMKTLADSNLKANRAIRQVSPTSSQSPLGQSQ